MMLPSTDKKISNDDEDADDSMSWTATTESDSNTTSSSLSTQQHHHQQQQGPGEPSQSPTPNSHSPRSGHSIHRYSPAHSGGGSVMGHVFIGDDDYDERSHDFDDQETASTTSSCLRALQNYADEEAGVVGGGSPPPAGLDESSMALPRTDAFDLNDSSHSAAAAAVAPPLPAMGPPGEIEEKWLSMGGGGGGMQHRSPDAVNALAPHKQLHPRGRKSSKISSAAARDGLPPSLSVKLDPDEYLVRHWNANDGPIDFNASYDYGYWNNNGNGQRQRSRNDNGAGGGAYYSETEAAVVPNVYRGEGEEDEEEKWLSLEEDEEACERAAAAYDGMGQGGGGYHHRLQQQQHQHDEDAPLTPRPQRRRRDNNNNNGKSSSSTSSQRFDPPRTWSFPPHRDNEWRETAAVMLSPVEKMASQLHHRHVGGGGGGMPSAASSVDGRVLYHSTDSELGRNLQSFSKRRRHGRRDKGATGGGGGGGGNGNSRSETATAPEAHQVKILPRSTRLGRLFLGALFFALSSMSMALWYIHQPKMPISFFDAPAATTTATFDRRSTNLRNEMRAETSLDKGQQQRQQPQTINLQDMLLGARNQHRFTVFLKPSSSRRSLLSDRGRKELALNSIDVHSTCPQVDAVHMSLPTDDSLLDDKAGAESGNFFGRAVDGGGKVRLFPQTDNVGRSGSSMMNLLTLGTAGGSSSESFSTKTGAVLLLADDVVLTCEEMERAFQIWKQNSDRMVGFYGYRHVPGPNSSNGGANADGYSIVSDRAAFVHRDLLARVSADVGAEDESGSQMSGSPCEDAELSVRITALTSRPPIVVAGRPLELRSELDTMAGGHGSTRDGTEWDVNGESCLSALMRELGKDDLPVEKRMYIGHGTK